MKKVVVTGSSGKAGRATVKYLQERDYEVFGVDQADGGMEYGSFFRADLTDLGQTVEALKGADAVVHHAAIPAPFRFSPSTTFQTNIISTYNVFQAAVTLGIKHVVWSSSETTLGLPFEDEKPEYAPINEESTLYPESSYALSKVLSEEMARQFNRWGRGDGTTFIGLRLSNIMEPQDYAMFPAFSDDPYYRKWNLWGYIDAEDVAQACMKGIEADIEGAESYIIAAADTCMTQTNKELMDEVFPGVPLKAGTGDHNTLLSIDKARKELGFEPAFSWRNRI